MDKIARLKYIIVDDNKIARMALKQIASGISGLEFMAECESAMDAYNCLEKNPVDFVLLDIEMPEITGLEFAKQMAKKNIFVIYTTGKIEYAIDAFEINIVDYIVKPVSLQKLVLAIDKLKEIINLRESNVLNASNDFFFIKYKGALKKVKMSEVLFFEAMGDYVKIQTKEKSFAIHSTLKNIEEKLDQNSFIRVHRSNIVAINHIEKIEDNVITIHSHSIALADTYKSALNEKLNMF